MSGSARFSLMYSKPLDRATSGAATAKTRPVKSAAARLRHSRAERSASGTIASEKRNAVKNRTKDARSGFRPGRRR